MVHVVWPWLNQGTMVGFIMELVFLSHWDPYAVISLEAVAYS